MKIKLLQNVTKSIPTFNTTDQKIHAFSNLCIYNSQQNQNNLLRYTPTHEHRIDFNNQLSTIEINLKTIKCISYLLDKN